MMISLFFSFHFLEAPPDHLRVFFWPSSRDVDLSQENTIAPPPPPRST